MDSNLLIRIHLISAQLFLLTYLIKTILLFSNKKALQKYASATKVPEMIISTIFLVTGLWLFYILGGIKIFQILKLIFVFAAIPIAIIGFKKMKKGLALLSLILIIGAYGLAEMSKSKTFIPKNVELTTKAESPVANGARVYLQNCAFCHGNDGKKAYRNSKDLTTSILDEETITKVINEGIKGRMPAYKLIISDENISDMTLYLSSIRNPVQAAGMEH